MHVPSGGNGEPVGRKIAMQFVKGVGKIVEELYVCIDENSNVGVGVVCSGYERR